MKIMHAFLSEMFLNLRTKIFSIITLVFLLSACGNDRPFDSNAWQRGDLRTRGSMAEDLIDRKLLKGRTVADVERLLGSPDRSYAGSLVYKIDMGMPFKEPGRNEFIVHLDSDRKAREAQITD